MLLRGETVALDDEGRGRIEQENDRMAGKGLRVLGVATGRLPPGAAADSGGLTWLGLVAWTHAHQCQPHRALYRAGIRP
jgi:magnesium-transporting ATPase (P-type)